jgi:hypothetical protein
MFYQQKCLLWGEICTVNEKPCFQSMFGKCQSELKGNLSNCKTTKLIKDNASLKEGHLQV